jgi:transcriptional regulator with XRE-family HTH domain
MIASNTLHLAPPEADVILARNLVVARLIAGITQHELAAASRVSRATIAQIETGQSDPRLSTLVILARALQVSPLVLLAGPLEVQGLADVPQDLADRPVTVSGPTLERMKMFLQSGLPTDRNRAAHFGATVARAAGEHGPSATITAAIFSAHAPGGGTTVGTSLGRLLEPL